MASVPRSYYQPSATQRAELKAAAELLKARIAAKRRARDAMERRASMKAVQP
jgi:hypothetical protein